MRFIGFYDYTVILTYLSVISAFIGMIFAHNSSFDLAMLCLLLSGICDAFDGTVARTKKNRTDDEKSFGIQLDSLCDVVSFGVAPAFCCYCTGMDSTVGSIILCGYCICAVIRLAYFNVLEAKRQQVETGCNKYYRGLPVTSSSIIFPVFYQLYPVLSENLFLTLLNVLCVIVAFLFVLDFQVKKPNFGKLIGMK